jgi:hypothetical protein
MKSFFSHNDKVSGATEREEKDEKKEGEKDKISGATEREEKDEKKEGEKELIFLKAWPAALERGGIPFQSPARGLQPLDPAGVASR